MIFVIICSLLSIFKETLMVTSGQILSELRVSSYADAMCCPAQLNTML